MAWRSPAPYYFADDLALLDDYGNAPGYGLRVPGLTDSTTGDESRFQNLEAEANYINPAVLNSSDGNETSHL